MTDQHFLCVVCGDTYPSSGNCATHPEEDLLDVRSEDVVRFLSDIDYSRRMRALTMWSLGGAGVVAGAVIVLQPSLLLILGGGFLGGVIGVAIAQARFTPKYLRWTRPLDG